MNPLQMATFFAGVLGTVLTQIVPILPEGGLKEKLGMLSIFLGGLAINVFKKKRAVAEIVPVCSPGGQLTDVKVTTNE